MNATTSLRDVFENHYRADRLTYPADETVKKWRQMIRLADRALGTVATVANLNATDLEHALQALERFGITPCTRNIFRRHFTTLWVYCEDQGLASDAPRLGAANKYRRQLKSDLSPSSGPTLLQVYVERFTPPSKGMNHEYRWAIRWMDRALRRPATLTDLTEVTLQLVSGAMLSRGLQDETAKNFRSAIRAIWNFLFSAGMVETAPGGETPTVLCRDGSRAQNWGCRKSVIVTPSGKKRVIVVSNVEIEKLTPADSLATLLDAYAARKLRGAHPGTLLKFRMAIAELEFLLDRPALIEDLRDENIEGVMWQLQENGRSIVTSNWYRSKLVALANFAARRGIIKTFPDVDKMTEPRRDPIAWNREQLGILFRACQQQHGMIAGIEARHWLTALHAVIWNSGERISATLSARWENLDLATGLLTIKAEARKGRTEDKTSRLHPDTLELLERIREPERDLIFPWPFTMSTLYGRYATMLRRAGLPCDRKRKFHCMRKSSASWLKLAGGDAQAHLGHSDASVTRAYLAPSICQTSHASDLLFRPALLLTAGGAQ